MGRFEKLARRAAGYRHRAQRTVVFANQLKMFDGQEVFDPPGELGKRQALVETPPATGSQGVCVDIAFDRAVAMRHKWFYVKKPQPLGKPLVDTLGGRIETRVRAVDGDARGDQIQEHAAGRRIAGESFESPKGQGMVCHDEVGPPSDGLGNNRRGDRQAGHQPLDLGPAVADQQAHIIPILGQFERREAGKKIGDRIDGYRLRIVCGHWLFRISSAG